MEDFFLVTLIKMCSWSTSYIAFVVDIIVNTLILWIVYSFKGLSVYIKM